MALRRNYSLEFYKLFFIGSYLTSISSMTYLLSFLNLNLSSYFFPSLICALYLQKLLRCKSIIQYVYSFTSFHTISFFSLFVSFIFLLEQKVKVKVIGFQLAFTSYTDKSKLGTNFSLTGSLLTSSSLKYIYIR